MLLKKISRLFGLLYIIGHLIALAKAGIQIAPCATSYDLRSVNECTIYTEDKPVNSYCISSTIIYVLGNDYKPICYNAITDNSNSYVFNKVIVMHDKVMSIIDISRNNIDLYADLPTMALINCGYYSQYGYYYCYQTTGIVSDKAKNYFSINNNSTISNEKLTPTSKSCSKSNIGSLVNINNSTELCLSEEAHAPLSSSGSYHLLMGTNSNSPFPSSYNYPLLIHATSNYFINDYHSMMNSNYVDSATNMITTSFYEGTFFDKLYSCKEGYCFSTDYTISTNVYMYDSNNGLNNIYIGIMYSFYNNGKGKVIVEKSNASGIMAFLYNNGMVKVKDENFASKTFFTSTTLPLTSLFYCQNGQCLFTNGFLKYINSKGNISVAHCSPYCTKDITYTSCTYSEIAYYDSKQSKFMLCIKNRTSPKTIVPVEIPVNRMTRIFDIYAAATSPYYYLFESNGSGNAIGYSKAKGGILYDINEDGMKEMMGCYRTDENNPTYCQVLANYDGYYINIESQMHNSLIYCTSSSCEIVSKDNGYFSNSSKELIKCSESVCLLEPQTYISCIKDGEVIALIYNNNVNVYYCEGRTPTLLPNNDAHYILSNVVAKYTYPNIVSGKDTIILKANKYSVTQIVTDAKGLCYDDTKKIMIKDDSCISAGLSHYYCSSICKTCTGEKELNAVYNVNATQPSSCASYVEDNNLKSGAISILSYSKTLNIMIIALFSLILLL